MDLQRFVRAITMAMVMAVLAVAPLSAQTGDADDPETIVTAFLTDAYACYEDYSPNRTAACMSKAIVKHHDALLPYAEDLIAALDDATAGPDQLPLIPDFAVATAAALFSDPGLCNDLNAEEMRRSCGAAIAQIDDDPRRCEALRDPEDRVLCPAFYIEIDPGDVGDCGIAGDIGIDDADMGRLTGADLCLAVATRLNDTPGLCREIENPELRSWCIFASMMPPPKGWTDIGICDEIVGMNLNDPEEQVGPTSPEGLREMCTTMAAVAAIDSPQALAMCDRIGSPELRDVCLFGAANRQKDGTFCDHINSKPLHKLCLGAVAGVKDERTQAAVDAFTKEFLATVDTSDAPDQVAEGHFGDAAICTELLSEPADCMLRENRITLKLSGYDWEVEGTGTIVAEVPTARLGGTSWDVGVEPCPVATAHGEITFTGGFAGLYSRDTMRGRAQVEWRHDPTTSESEGARCGPKGLIDHSLWWEATLRDGSIDGAIDFGANVIPFVVELKAE